MMYSIDYSKDAQKSIKKLKRSNPVMFKKLVKILDELMEHPYEGTGHPESLVGGDGVLYSRRLSAHDRIIYEIHDDTVNVLVVSVEGHYSGK